MERLIALIVLVLASVVPISAQVLPGPALLQFQGRLTKPDGTPVPDGTYSLRFSLWSASTAGSEKWNQTLHPVGVKNGTFAVLLNVASPVTLFDTNLWMEIKIGSDAPLSPRQPLASIAYAMKANTVPDNSITDSKIVSLNYGKLTNIPPNSGTAWSLTGNSGTKPSLHFLGTTDNQPLVFRSNNLERMRLLSNGNFGIGTNVPSALLHIYTTTANDNIGTLRYENGNTGTGLATNAQLLGVSRYGALQNLVWENFGARIGMRSTANGGQGNLYFTSGSDTVFMTGTAGGNVGIGTSAPAAKLDVAGRIRSQELWTNAIEAGSMRLISGSDALVVQSMGTGIQVGSLSGTALFARAPDTRSYAVYADGRAGGSSAWEQISDARFKQNVQPLNNALATILRLQGVTYDWNRADYPQMSFPARQQIGFLAQEVEKLLPELVSADTNGYKSVAYSNLIPVLVEAIKQQQKQIETLQSQSADFKQMKAENAALRAHLTLILQRLNTLEHHTTHHYSNSFQEKLR